MRPSTGRTVSPRGACGAARYRKCVVVRAAVASPCADAAVLATDTVYDGDNAPPSGLRTFGRGAASLTPVHRTDGLTAPGHPCSSFIYAQPLDKVENYQTAADPLKASFFVGPSSAGRSAPLAWLSSHWLGRAVALAGLRPDTWVI